MLEHGRGKIINMASLLSYQGGFRVPAYAASKGAVVTFSRSLSNEWAQKGININCIAPGYFNTDINEALMADEVRSRQILERIPTGRWGAPDDIVGTAVFLASTASDYVNGTVITVDGGWMGR
jgi:2-deoxy-D-gluconate 3-dehydrogenase